MKHLTDLQIPLEELNDTSKTTLKTKIYKLDSQKWDNEILGKTTLSLYRQSKQKIEDEGIYDNSYASDLLFRCRTNTLQLNDRKRHQQEDTKCPMCEHNYEDLEHFLLICPGYQEERKRLLILQQPYEEDHSNIIKRLLLFDKDKNDNNQSTVTNKHANLIKNIYTKRKMQIQNNQN